MRPAGRLERAELVDRVTADYAQSMVDAGEWGAKQALHAAQRTVKTRLASPRAKQELLCICAGEGGATVGDLWLQYREEGGQTVCAVLYIFIAEGARGQGHAQKALLAAETRAVQAGAVAMRLTVAGSNEPAWALYHKLGYGVLNARLHKPLQPSLGTAYPTTQE